MRGAPPDYPNPPRARISSHRSSVLFASGVAQSFFAPLLVGLALGLAGHDMFTRRVAWNEAHNHLGEVCSAVFALFVVTGGVSPVFYLIGAIALLAGGAALLIRHEEIDHDLQSGRPLLEPFTLLVCVLARSPGQLILVQALRCVAQGSFGIAIVAVSHEVARGTGRFQALTGASRAALAAGALAGPLPTGFLMQRAGFNVAFLALTLVAAAGAAAFLLLMPETRVRAEES